MIQQAYYWLVLFVVLIIIEIITMGLTTIWFAGGSLVAFFAAIAGANIYVQLTLFLAVSLLLLIVTRPMAQRYLFTKKEKTNVDSLIGRSAVVLEPVNNLENTGKVLLNGIEWTARAEKPDIRIEKDTVVRVLRIEGVKVIIEKGEE